MQTKYWSLYDDVYPIGVSPDKFHTRVIVRAIIIDGDHFLFTQISRNDIFANLTYIETSGGGVEEGEDLIRALHRELKEELGIEVEVLGKLAVVDDEYLLIGRHNIQHYYLVRKIKDIHSHLTEDEKKKLHLKKLRLTPQEALDYYEKNKDEKLTHLIYQREVPVLLYALNYIKEQEIIK